MRPSAAQVECGRKLSTNFYHEPLAGAVHSGLPELLHSLTPLLALHALDMIESRRSVLSWRVGRKARPEQVTALTEGSFEQNLLSPEGGSLVMRQDNVCRKTPRLT